MGEGDEERDDPLALELQQLQITHEDLQKEHETLNASHAEVCATLEAAQARVAELEAKLEASQKKVVLLETIEKAWEQRSKNIKADYIETRKNIEAALREFQP
jgi:Tfp pilus assembly protein PilX